MPHHYRADIDGLRAIAVLAVLFYHARVPGFGGGFIGVDVFFVISGYLITTILLKDLQHGRFSIARFYERRIRRIFPALFVMLGFTWVAGFLLYGPEDFEDLGKTTAAATVFISNLVFADDAGYFDGPAELKPLLHTWSLAIEEQFYIGFPILLWLIARYARRRYAIGLIAIVAVSFVLSLMMVARWPTLAFFSMWPRAWELLLGSLVAVGIIPPMRHALGRGLVATGALAAIAWSVVAYTERTAFPGAAALLPTVGAAALIHVGAQGHWWSRVVAHRYAVGIGLVSYSLYLWHWPLLVYARHVHIEPLPVGGIALVLAASGLAAYASWRWIEQPFRHDGALALTRSRVFTAAAVAMGLSLIAGGGVWRLDGFPTRVPPHIAGGFAKDPDWAKWGDCQDASARLAFEAARCHFGAADAAASVFLWGDSHARALAPAADVSAARRGLGGSVATMNGCAPLIGIERTNRTRCYRFNERVLQHIEAHPTLTTVVLAGRWAVTSEGSLYKSESGRAATPYTLVDMAAAPVRPIDNRAGFRLGLQRTLDALARMNRRVVIVLPVPEVGHHVPSAAFVGDQLGLDVEPILNPRRRDYTERNRFVLRTVAALPHVRVIDPTAALCDGDRCHTLTADGPLYRDGDHLTTLGARLVGTLFDQVLSPPR